MIVRVPEQDPAGVTRMLWIGSGGVFAVREDVVPADRVVVSVEHIAVPLAHEHAFGCPRLVAGVGVDRAATLRRPAHDLDLAVVRIVDETPETVERGRRGV